MIEPLTFAIAGAVMLWLGRGSGADVLPLLAPKYRSERNDRMVGIIQTEFAKHGLGATAIAAAVANAYAESGLNPLASGDGGHSIGLFQLNDWGAGHGLSVAYRQDPTNNARTILSREVLASAGKTLRARAAAGAGVGELAAIFARDIERPADKAGAMASRASLAEAMFPALVKGA